MTTVATGMEKKGKIPGTFLSPNLLTVEEGYGSRFIKGEIMGVDTIEREKRHRGKSKLGLALLKETRSSFL